MWNWDKCAQGKVNFCRLNPTDKDVITKRDVDVWEKIYAEKIDTFKISPLYQVYVKACADRATCQNNFILTNNRSINNSIRRLDHEILQLEKEMSGGISTDKMLTMLSIKFQRQFRRKEITAKEYFNLIEEYERND